MLNHSVEMLLPAMPASTNRTHRGCCWQHKLCKGQFGLEHRCKVCPPSGSVSKTMQDKYSCCVAAFGLQKTGLLQPATGAAMSQVRGLASNTRGLGYVFMEAAVAGALLACVQELHRCWLPKNLCG